MAELVEEAGEVNGPEELVLELEIDQDTGRLVGAGEGLDYSARVARLLPRTADVAGLVADCAVVHAEEESSFWLGCDDAPRCELERLARRIFASHVPSKEAYDRTRSGAEWWVQVRDPESDDDDDGDEEAAGDAELEGASIPFHWDKDETLAGLHGVYLHPLLSTVTFLTAGGAPTIVAPIRIGADGALDLTQRASSLVVAYPDVGRHVVFDGRFLHAAPTALAEEPAAGRRVTFLVNIWLNHAPCGIDRYGGPPLSPPAEAEAPSIFETAPPSALAITRGDLEGLRVIEQFPLRAAADLRVLVTLPIPDKWSEKLAECPSSALYEVSFPEGDELEFGGVGTDSDGDDSDSDDGGRSAQLHEALEQDAQNARLVDLAREAEAEERQRIEDERKRAKTAK